MLHANTRLELYETFSTQIPIQYIPNHNTGSNGKKFSNIRTFIYLSNTRVTTVQNSVA